ncbi:MAG: hypothetical protein FAF03_06840 [Epsilonproteobacteria bacterium]|nr:hypothetical protein [Campylobacterota bacterium]
MLKLFYRLILFFILILSATLLYQKNTYTYHTLTRTNPIPHTQTLINEEKYMDAYTYLNYFMQFDYMKHNPKSKALLNSIQTKRQSLSYQSEKIAQGISTGTSDELSGQMAAIGSDFLVIGDIRDLALEGTHYFKHEEVDPVLVSLSTIGLVASASTLFTLGSSAVAKSGISVLKLAHKSKRIPMWLSKYLVRESKVIRQTKDISSIKPLFKTLDTMHKEVGLQETLKLLSRTQNFKDLKSLSKLTKRYGKETDTLLKLSDKKLLTHANRLNKIDKKTMMLASTYGSNGFVHLIKGGEKNFIKTTKRMKAYAKVGYKGEVWKVFLWLMKHLSDTTLMLLMGVSVLLLIPWKRLKSYT